MNKNNLLTNIIACLITCSILSACGKQQLVPSDLDHNLFEVEGTQLSPEDKLRQDFHKETGCYLIFSDTLRKGKLIEVIDLDYTITVTGDYYHNNHLYEFDYFETDQKKIDAVNFLKGRVIKYTSSSVLPYSYLLVDTIIQYTYDRKKKNYDFEKPNKKNIIIQGLYTSAIAGLGDIEGKDEDTKRKVQLEILNTMVTSSLNKVDENKFEKFYSFSLPYYDMSYDSDNLNEMPDVSDLKELGFLKAYSFRPKERMSFYPKSKDKEVFIKELLKKPESEWQEEYKDFPLVIAKLEALKEIVLSMGYNLTYLSE